MHRWMLIAVIVAAAACTSNDDAAPASTPTTASSVAPTSTTDGVEPADRATTTAPDDIVVPTTPENGTVMAAIVRGVVERTDDCLYLRSGTTRSILVFPFGTTIDDVGAIYPDGTRVPTGAAVVGGGGTRQLPVEASGNLPAAEINACVTPGVDSWVQLEQPAVEAILDHNGGIDGPVLYARNPGDGDCDYEAAAAIGELSLVDGCVGLGAEEEFRPLLWPFGTTWDDEQQAVVTPSGQVIAIGEVVDTGGGSRSADGLDQFTNSSGVAQQAGACSSTGDVFVIQSPVL